VSLPTCRAADLETRLEEQRWLIEGLWADRGVGILGGEAKLGKSWLALDVAIAVAAGGTCLGRFEVPRPGPVLLYAAEDALHVVRERLEAISVAAGLVLADLPLYVITAPRIRLDVARDRAELRETIEEIAPRLLVLDPFIRLHSIDENVASEVAPLLAYLRQIERELGVAVLLVHHARKGGGVRPGQALRGSSDLHAWGDSNLYLQRRGGTLWLTVEHRAARSPPPLPVALCERGDGLSMAVLDEAPAAEKPRAARSRDRVLSALSAEPASVRVLREHCRMKTATLCDVLTRLVADGDAVKEEDGYRRTAGSLAACVSLPTPGLLGNGNGKHDPLPGETEVGSAGEQPAEG
jgi:hypothetical protein